MLWDVWGPDPELESGFGILWTYGSREEALEAVAEEQEYLLREHGLAGEAWEQARERLPWPYYVAPFVVVPRGVDPDPFPNTLGYTQEEARRALQSLRPGERRVFRSRWYEVVLECREDGLPAVTIREQSTLLREEVVSASGDDAPTLLARFWKHFPGLVPEELRRFFRGPHGHGGEA
jgi:hypothetical protein